VIVKIVQAPATAEKMGITTCLGGKFTDPCTLSCAGFAV